MKRAKYLPSLRIPGTIARELGVRIVSGKLKPGTVLEGEIDASQERKVSRSAYREAVRILVAKGLVQSKPKIGTKVSEREIWHLLDPDVLSWIFQTEPDKSLLLNLFELRKVVEPEVAALAAQRRSAVHLRAMRSALKRMLEHTLAKQEGQDADRDFHTALFVAAGNQFLGSLTSSINSVVAWSTVFKHRYKLLRRDAVADHQKVYLAVETRDCDAARLAMAELVDLAYDDIVAAPRTSIKKARARKRLSE